MSETNIFDEVEIKRKHDVLKTLKSVYPDTRTALDFKTPLQMLVATILSAQCTDKQVNLVTPSLFAKYEDANDLMTADRLELEQLIKSTGFYRNKAKSIIGAATMLVKEFNGNVPNNMKDILRLPGVARKTANVVLSEAYGVIEGIAVDTHVKRLSGRLGLSNENTPEKIERDLMNTFPRNDWYDVTSTLIAHGRAVCDARRPKCHECALARLCPCMVNTKETTSTSP